MTSWPHGLADPTPDPMRILLRTPATNLGSIMSPVRRFARPSALALVAAFVIAGAWAAPRTGLGQAAPAAGAADDADLLKGAPFDRITLIDNTPLAVEPLAPRPLPPPIRLKDEEGKERKTRKTKVKNDVGIPGETAQEGKTTEIDEDDPANILTIHLIQGDLRDFKVNRRSIKKVEYYEDLLLNKADALIRTQEFGRAFEYILAARNRDAKWAGIEDRVNKLLFAEGSEALKEGDADRGLRLLRELAGRKPDFPKLKETLAEVYGAQIARAFDAGAYAQGRRFLHEMEGFAPGSLEVKDARARYVARARESADRAAAATDPGERLDQLAEALRVWPPLEGAAARLDQASLALPTLDVGVADLPRAAADRAARGPVKVTAGLVGPWTRSPTADRIARLLYLPILAGDDDAALNGDAPGQIAGGLELGMLGQRLIVKTRPKIAWSDGSRPVAAVDIVRALTDRADPRSPAFNARWADLLARVELVDETHADIRLNRLPLRPASWLIVPIGPAHAAWDGWASVPGVVGRRPVGDGPFRWDAATDSVVTFRSAAKEAAAGPGPGPGPPRIRRIRERLMPSSTAAMAALLKGEVSLVDHVPADRVAALARDPEIRVARHGQVSLHRIALDGRNVALRNRALRRALSYAIDRRTLLEENVLKGPAAGENGLADGPFPKDSYADAKGVKPLDYDPLLARMLVVAAKKELGGGAIRLTFEYPATAEAQAAAPRIAEALKLAGLELKAVERPAAELEEELRSGRRFDLAYRATRMGDFVAGIGPMLCPGYDAPPAADGLAAVASPRILQQLLYLEQAGDVPTAKATLLRIDAETRDELPILPLWQLVDHYAWRARLTGPAADADHIYQGIESWEVAPWFAKDPW